MIHDVWQMSRILRWEGGIMIQIEYISDLNEVMRMLTEQEFNRKVNRNRSSYFYRGMPNSAYHLETSLKRNCKNKKSELEYCILRNFSKYAAIEDPELNKSVWKQLIIGQHHGLPTRLLDWTYSPLVGLHFATSGEDISNMEKHDSVIWRINIEEINSLLPTKYQEELNKERAYLFTVDMLDKLTITLQNYDKDMGDNAMVLVEPPSIDQRIINQYSYFTIIPKNMENIEKFLDKNTNSTLKYILKKEIKWRIRDMLDQMNINERIMYPGLDGLSQWLKRHYFVK